jgi:hypothetical protein
MVAEALMLLALSGRDTHPDDLPAVIRRAAGHLGARDCGVHLVDLSQLELISLFGRHEPAPVRLPVDASPAGRAYRTERIVAEAAGKGTRLWVPIQDSAERVGVLSLTFDRVDASVEGAVLAFASLTGEYVIAKCRYGDALERTRRAAPLTLAAEMRWALLPPLTFRSPALTISGLLEPAYDIAGDTFDYALVDDIAHLAIFDAMGHGLAASRMANLAVSSYRNSRRRDADLETTYHELDAVIASEFGDCRFVTAAMATFGVVDGTLRWLNAGHPAPLLVRGGRVLRELACRPTTPAGLGGEIREVAEIRLEPGDAVVLYTDGVVEARSPSGEQFGTERLSEHIARSASTGTPLPESLRRLMLGILAHQQNKLQDDATVLFASWHGPDPAGRHEPTP